MVKEKRDGTKKVRVVHNLSYPVKTGRSVNEAVTDVPLRIQSFDDAAAAVRRLGKGCYLIKLDVKQAYKQIAVRPEDWHLLGFKWLDEYYHECVLPFGLKSSCRLWDMFAEALHYFFEKHLHIDVVVHYVDDFLFVVEGLESAGMLLEEALALCEKLGVPMAAEKTEGPCTALVFVGIHLDTVAMQASLPEDKLEDLRQLASVWSSKETATIAELQSLVGTLQFACKVMRPGRHFVSRLVYHYTSMLRLLGQNARAPQSWPIPRAARADIQWWLHKAQHWNGVSLLYEVEWENDAHKVFLETDACETGYGASWGNEWFKGNWTPEEIALSKRRKKVSMPFMETYALVLAAATWGHLWRGKKIIFRTDCMVSYNTVGWKKKNSKNAQLQSLLRRLAEIACDFDFDYRAQHIAGVTNIAADALSRDNMVQFRVARPCAQALPTAQRKDIAPMPPPPVWLCEGTSRRL